MKPPLFVRPLTPHEQQTLERGLAASSAFVLRRCQALLQSAEGYTPRQIQHRVGISDQTVRNAIHAFNDHGLACLQPKVPRPRQGLRAIEDAAQVERLRALLHTSPRAFGFDTSLWSLGRVAQVCFAQGITARPVTGETIRATLERLGIGWRRAKRWVNSPDPAYRRKKGQGIG